MLVTVTDPALATLLSSQALILERWPDAAREVLLLLQILHRAAPTLADLLAIGLVVLVPATRSLFELQYERATIAAVGRRADRTEVPTQTADRLREITEVEIHNVRVDLAPAVP